MSKKNPIFLERNQFSIHVFIGEASRGVTVSRHKTGHPRAQWSKLHPAIISWNGATNVRLKDSLEMQSRLTLALSIAARQAHRRTDSHAVKKENHQNTPFQAGICRHDGVSVILTTGDVCIRIDRPKKPFSRVRPKAAVSWSFVGVTTDLESVRDFKFALAWAINIAAKLNSVANPGRFTDKEILCA